MPRLVFAHRRGFLHPPRIGAWCRIVVSNWHVGQVVVFVLGAALVDLGIYALVNDWYDAPLAVQVALTGLFFGVPFVVLGVLWKWFGGRPRGRE